MATLPWQPTSFVGRRDAIEAASHILRQPRVHVLVMTGPGGVGKTRLALEVAAAVMPAFADGGAFVSLAPLTSPDQLFSTIANSLAAPHPDRAPDERLRTFLGPRAFLLVLDNFETVAGAASDLASLLDACPRLSVLVTSRVRLDLTCTHTFAVPPLPLPPHEERMDASRALEYDAPRLFVERAQATSPHFALTDDNAADVAAICRRLDGLPLAIELAATRTRLLSPRDLLVRLDRQLPLLTGATTDAPARFHTMRDAIAWSYDLLPDADRALFRRLAVFRGSFTIDAAEAIVAGIDDENGANATVLDRLDNLTDHHLISTRPADDGTVQFTMLEVIREFALEKLKARRESDAMQRAHAAHYLGFAASTRPHLFTPSFPQAMAALTADLDNFRAALAWAADHSVIDFMFQLCTALWELWYQRGLVAEGRTWVDRALEHAGPPLLPRGYGLSLSAFLAWIQGDNDVATTRQEQAITIARQFDDLVMLASCHNFLALAAWQRNDAGAMVQQAEAARAIFRKLDDQIGEAISLIVLGLDARHREAFDEAQSLFERARFLTTKTGFVWLAAAACYCCGEVAATRGAHQRAADYFLDSLGITSQLGDRWGTGAAIAGIAGLAAHRGDRNDAARLFGAAEALIESAGAFLPTLDPRTLEELQSTVQTAVREPDFTRLSIEGRKLPWNEAVALAERVANRLRRPVSRPDIPHLTKRELEVLRLVAEDLADKEIAVRLNIASATVRHHLDNAFVKLGVSSRAGAVARALHQGLLQAVPDDAVE